MTNPTFTPDSLNLTKYLYGDSEIRQFSDPVLQEQINSATNSIPAGHTGAVIAHADLVGTSLTVVGKVGDHWTVVAAGYKDWSGPMNAEAEVKYSW